MGLQIAQYYSSVDHPFPCPHGRGALAVRPSFGQGSSLHPEISVVNLDGVDGVEGLTVRTLHVSQHGKLLLLALGQGQGWRVTVVRVAQTAILR